MASTVQEKDIKRLREAGYLAKKIGHRLPPEDRSSLLRSPTRESCFFPHFVRGLRFPLHPFFCGVMYYYGIDFMIFPPILSLTSRHSSSCVRLFSGFRLTSACG